MITVDKMYTNPTSSPQKKKFYALAPDAWSVTWARLVAHGARLPAGHDVDFSRRHGQQTARSTALNARRPTTALTRFPADPDRRQAPGAHVLRSQIAPRVPTAPGGLRRLRSRRSLPPRPAFPSFPLSDDSAPSRIAWLARRGRFSSSGGRLPLGREGGKLLEAFAAANGGSQRRRRRR
jgi:hypothetical protein